MTDSDDTEMFDQDEEDKDLESQVSKGLNKAKVEKDEERSEREATPSPQAPANQEKPQTLEGAGSINLSDTPTSTPFDTSRHAESGEASSKQIPVAALPEKSGTSPISSHTGEGSSKQIPAAALPEKLANPPKPSEADKDNLKQTTAAALAEKPFNVSKPT